MKDAKLREGLTAFPIIAIFFFLAAVVAIAVSVIATLPVAGDVLMRFQEGSSASIPANEWLITTLVSIARYVAIALFALGCLALYWRHSIDRVLQQLVTRIELAEAVFPQDMPTSFGISRRSLLFWFLIGCGFVLTQNWLSVTNGFFRYDDFEILSLNRTKPLVELLFYPHADHTMPLFRIQVAFMTAVFGVWSLPYNLAILLIIIFTLLFGFLVLKELQVNQLAILLFMALYTGWTEWGAITTGYIILSAVTQTALFGLVSIWSYLRWTRNPRPILLLVSVLFMGLAIFVDIYGFWVPFAIVLFAICVSWARHSSPPIVFFKSHAWLLLGTLAILIIAALYNAYVFTEVVPGGFLVLSGKQYSIFGVAQQVFYLITGGVLLSSFFPIGYWRLPEFILGSILGVLFLLALALGVLVWKRMTQTIRWYSVAVFLCMFGTALESVLGRNQQGFHIWRVHHIFTPYLWYCVLIAIAWNAIWQKSKTESKPLMIQVTAAFVLAFLGLQTTFSYLASNVSWYTYGYISNIRDAETRKANIEELRDKLIVPLVSLSRDQIYIPALDGKYLFNRYPSLYVYNLSMYLDFIVPKGEKVLLVRNAAMQTWIAQDVQTVESLRSAVDSQFIRALEQDPYIQQLYLSGVELDSQSVKCPIKDPLFGVSAHLNNSDGVVHLADGSWLVDSNGETWLAIAQGSWDPESRHRLQLGIEYLSNKISGVVANVSFRGELKIPYGTSRIALDAQEGDCLSIDLLQIYGYALNSRVGELKLGFPVAGKYRITNLELQ